jgi:hypothetical protein
MTTGPARGAGPVVWRVLRRGKPPLREGGEERQVDLLCPIRYEHGSNIAQ